MMTRKGCPAVYFFAAILILGAVPARGQSLFSIGVGGEANLLSLGKGFSGAGLVSADWRLRPWLALEVRVSGGYGTGKLISLESQVGGRVYFVRPGPFEFFFQGGVGLMAILRNAEVPDLRGSLVGGLTLGSRILLDGWYIEPYVRGAYPLIAGGGIVVGFTPGAKKRGGADPAPVSGVPSGTPGRVPGGQDAASGAGTGAGTGAILGEPVPAEPLQVVVLPFEGAEEPVNAWFTGAAGSEIGNLGYVALQREFPAWMRRGEFAPDEPPARNLTGGQRYALTGAAYPDGEEYHLQLWLWDTVEPALIYTDELVCEEVTESGEFLALLVEWLFSHLEN